MFVRTPRKRNLAPARASGGARAGRPHDSRLRFARRAKATLRHVRFSSGTRLGPLALSPHLSGEQQERLEFWIRRMPEAFLRRLPRIKLVVAEELNWVQKSVFINETLSARNDAAREHTHAVSFIPERYIVLEAGLFRRRIELGRILYHELCHFVWPRLGNPKRRRFQALLRRELRERIAGELGYSSEHRKAGLPARSHGASRPSLLRKKRDYFCESFCDTGSFVLLGKERRNRHSEYTLSAAGRQRRCRAWSQMVLESQARTQNNCR